MMLRTLLRRLFLRESSHLFARLRGQRFGTSLQRLSSALPWRRRLARVWCTSRWSTRKFLLAGLLGAIGWNMITLILGLPTSSSHALMGGYGGAAVAKAGFVAVIPSGWTKPGVFIFLSPVIGMLIGMIVTVVTSWIVRKQRPLRVDRWFRRLQLLSAAGY